ncbi:MAG: DNA alkylation repair protein [Bacilli bacterium]|nr:DNA alkylation repair protein [Bacilli bacterium]
MKYKELKELLLNNGDKKFSEFSKTLSNSDYNVIGVKNPILRQIIKDHVKDNELKTEEFGLGEYLEIDFIYFGLSLSRLKNVEDQLEFLKKNIRYAKSWAITDTVSTYIKKHDFAKYYDFFKSMHNTKHTYERRMAYILGLKHYKNEQILKVLDCININEEYMVMMAEAWLLATIAISYPNGIYEFLTNCKDTSLKRKTISKIKESFRIDANTKDKFVSLRD